MGKHKSIMQGMVFLILLCGGSGLTWAEEEAEAPVIPWDDTSPVCVAWEADKLFMLVSNENPVGINCSGVFLLEKTDEGTVGVLDVPVLGFDSGEKSRDEEVAEILGADGAKSISFKTKPYTRSDWRINVMDAKGRVDGVLTIAGKETPVTLSFVAEGDYLLGRLETSFTALRLEPPSVGWGSIALVRDPLVLHFRVKKTLTQIF